MIHIIEYIGKGGIKHAEFNHTRATTPKPGDPIDFGENEGYPFEKRFGRVAKTDHLGTGTIHVCLEHGSAFLGDGYVSISGGPFTNIMPDQLEATYKLKTVGFWNWGNHLPGARRGVGYLIARPLFRLKKRTDEHEARVAAAFKSDTA